MSVRKQGAAFAFVLLSLLPLAAGADGPAEERILAKPLRLDLWGVSLDETVRAVREQAGVDILFHLPDLPAEFTATENVWLVSGRVSLGTVMESLARRFGFRFRVSGAGRIEVSRGYGWVGEEGALRFIRTQPLESGDGAGDESGDASGERPGGDPGGETAAFLREFIKPLELLGGDFTIRFESYPVPDNPAFLRGTAVMPAVLADYLERAVDCLAGSGGDYPALRPNPALFARAAEYGRDWEELLARRVHAPEAAGIRAILLDVADQAGVAIVLRTPPPESGLTLPADIDHYTLGRMTEELASGWNLGRRVFLPCGAVVFERGAGEGYETDDRSRELFWDGLAVAGFDVRAAAERVGPAALTMILRRTAFPGLWRDPVCSLVYSRATGRLAAVAPLNAVEAVADALRAME